MMSHGCCLCSNLVISFEVEAFYFAPRTSFFFLHFRHFAGGVASAAAAAASASIQHTGAMCKSTKHTLQRIGLPAIRELNEHFICDDRMKCVFNGIKAAI